MLNERFGSAYPPLRKDGPISLLREPTVKIGAFGAWPASGGGGELSSTRSARVRSSMIGVPVSDAIRAISFRAARGITAPVGFWQLGERYTNRAAVAANRSRSVAGVTPPAFTASVERRAPIVRNAAMAPKYVGSSTRAASPRCRHNAALSAIACCAPFVIRTWSRRVGNPSREYRSAIACRKTGSPSG
jgi:hypothetical protein